LRRPWSCWVEQDRIRDAYGVNYDRLVELETQQDPTNLCHLNPNIEPAG
jgi:hypothetical protein